MNNGNTVIRINFYPAAQLGGVFLFQRAKFRPHGEGDHEVVAGVFWIIRKKERLA